MTGKDIGPQEAKTYQPKQDATALVRQEILTHETAGTVLAAQEEARIKARAYLAMTRPRDIDKVRQRFLLECSRPSFAEEALYAKPIGGGGGEEEGGGKRGGKSIEGPSIRFAEAAAVAMGNIESSAVVIYDDGDTRRMRVTVQDLEANVTHSKDITFRKVVERRFLRDGEVAISARTNSYGKTVYLRKATDDEMLNTENALVSKCLRTLLLRVVPGWLQAEGEATVRSVLANNVKQDPEAQRRRLFDAFAGVGVPVDAVKTYLGHDAATLTEKEHRDLLGVYNTIKNGEASWQEVVEARLAAEEAKPGPAKAAEDEPKAESPPPAKGAEALVQRVQKEQKEDPGARLARLAKAAAAGPEGDPEVQRPLMPMPPAGAKQPPPARAAGDEEEEPGSDG